MSAPTGALPGAHERVVPRRIADKLNEIVARSRSLENLLESAVAMIAQELRADACSLFLFDAWTSRLTLRASAGISSSERGHADAAQAAAEGLAGLALSQMLPEARKGPSRSLVAVPMALRGQPIGVLVVQAAGRPHYAAADIQALFGVAAQMVGVVENARVLEALGRGEDLTASKPHPDVRRDAGEHVVHGIAASPGVAIGTAIFRRAFPRWHGLAPRTSDEAAERARLCEACEMTRNDIASIQSSAARDLGEEHALIFASHLLMLADPALRDRLDRALSSGKSAAEAVEVAFGEIADRLRATGDPYLRERVEDVDDLHGRLLGHLAPQGAPASIRAQVVVGPRITPSLVMEMKGHASRGIVAELGGETSHGVLLARSLGLPAVTGADGIMESIDAGDLVVIDGSEGLVVVRPTPETVTHYEDRARQEARRRTEFARFRDRPAMTADGAHVTLLGNVAFGADIALARNNGAEGIGLYRTEFPFIVRDGFPTCDEQARIYRKAYDAFPGASITFRLLDLAGDKFVSSRGPAASRDAFHGYRSIRVLFDHPHVLRDQVQALALAAGARPLRILVPMVTSLQELLRIQAMTARAIDSIGDGEHQRRPGFGAMIEVPGAIEIIEDLAPHVDFFSIGTNDLIQYALVADRDDARMAPARDPYHPAVLRMIRRAIAAAHRAGKLVSVCGEMAARPDLAMALVVLGADALSVAPAVVPELKQALASASLGLLAAEMDAVLASPDGPALQSALGKACRLRP
ncbi:MAG TPA: phosphoenolpyruvate--protein phosphotransferase [Polyangiaceae bacterium]|nr:phosphoenolpyruvate--protein phosphotransferase [Polyangiaceae bacterium]